MTLGSDSETAMSSMRPPMLAGPIERKRKLWSSGSDDWLMTGGGGGAAAAGAWAWGRTANPEIASAAMATASEAPRYKRLGSNLIEAMTPEKRPTISSELRQQRWGRLPFAARAPSGQCRSTMTGWMRTA